MDIQILQKFQIKNERGNLKYCQVCEKQFGVFTREHQCKRCFRSVCAECGETKRDVYKQNMNRRPHRVCDICKSESDFIVEFIGVNKLLFGKDSEIAERWHKKLPEVQQQNLMTSIGKKNYRKFTVQIFNELWNAYNYSVREFIGIMTYNMNQNEVYEIILKVYEELQTTGIDEKIQNLIFLIAFLLCFSSPETTIDLIRYLYDLRKTITQGKQLLILYLKSLHFAEQETRKLTDYINYKIKQFVATFSVNLIPVQSSIHILTRVFEKKKLDEVYMFFSILLEQNKITLLQNKNNKTLNDILLIRNCKLNKIIEKYKQLVSVKSSPYIRSNTSGIRPSEIKIKQNKLREDETQSEVNIDVSENGQSLLGRGNFKKKMTYENDEKQQDSFSVKTISMNESNLVEHKKSRRTKPNKSIIKLQTIESIHSLECERCREKDLKMKELEDMIHKKNQQIDRMRLQTEISDYSSEKDQQHSSSELKRKAQSLEQQLYQKIQENDTLFRELSKHQKENSSMKSQLQELQINNKMLKNKIESSSMFLSGSIKNVQKQEQASRMNQIMKKSLVEKNKQIEQLMKKNKLLSYQIENQKPQVQQRQQFEPQSLKQYREHDKVNKELMQKLQQMSQMLIKEEAQKIQMSDKLFQLRERANTMPVVPSSQPPKKEQIKKKEDGGCAIF